MVRGHTHYSSDEVEVFQVVFVHQARVWIDLKRVVVSIIREYQSLLDSTLVSFIANNLLTWPSIRKGHSMG